MASFMSVESFEVLGLGGQRAVIYWAPPWSSGGAHCTAAPCLCLPRPLGTLGLAELHIAGLHPCCCCFLPLSLALTPPFSLSSSSPRLRSSFLGSVQLADTFATDGWCTRRQLSLPICGLLRDSGTDAF